MKKIFFFLLCIGLCSCQKEAISEITVETLPVSVKYDPETQTAVVDVSAAVSGDESSIHERGFIEPLNPELRHCLVYPLPSLDHSDPTSIVQVDFLDLQFS